MGQYPENQKLEMISLSLEGDVLSWFNGEDRRALFRIMLGEREMANVISLMKNTSLAMFVLTKSYKC